MTRDAARPASRRRVTKPPEERRGDLLEAARDLFSSRGVAATTISDITDAAGVGKGTFYLYFDSKEHVLGALWEDFVDGFLQHTATVLSASAGTGWLGLAERMVTELVDYDIAHRDIHRIVVAAANADVLRLFREANQKVLGLLRAGLTQGVAEGAFDVADPVLTADLLYYAAEGVLDDVLFFSDDTPDRDAIVTSLLEIVHRVLPGPREGAER